MTTREQLHQLVDALPETEVVVAARYLEFLTTVPVDPVALAWALAEPDDEPLTEEDLAAHREAQEDLAAGRVYPAAEVHRELGLDDARDTPG